LADLEGSPAEAALEDVMDVVVKPALVIAMGLPQEATLSDVRIEQAAFRGGGISFRLECLFSVPQGSSGAADGPTPGHDDLVQAVEGVVMQDLTVSMGPVA
jgi:hypothetical protein